MSRSRLRRPAACRGSSPAVSSSLVAALVVLVVVLAACGSDDAPLDTGDGPGGANGAGSDGTGTVPADGEYRSVEVTENGAPRPLVAGTTIALRIEDGTIGASAGCNQLGGSYTVDGDVLRVAELSMTEMGCDPPRHDQDEWLAGLLTADPTLAAATDGFTLTSADGATVIRFAERSVVEPDAALVGTAWEVTGFLDGEVAMSANVPEPGVLQLTDDGFVGGFDGCNSMAYDPAGDGLRYEIDGDRIRFTGNPISTLKACDDTEDHQHRFRAVLTGEVTWEITASTLTLLADDGRGVTYRAVER